MNLRSNLIPAIIISSLLVILLSCKEEKPLVNFTVLEKPLLDTVYSGSSVTAQEKAVVLMDITGVRCTNCPTAAQVARDIVAASPADRVHVIALYPFYQPPNTKPWDGYDTLNTYDAEFFGSQFGIPLGMPTGMIDQINYNSSRFIPYTQWSGLVSDQLKRATPFNLDLKSSWNSSTGKGRLEIKSTFLGSPTTDKYLLYVTVLENNIIGKQKSNSGEIDNYQHNHVLRQLVTLQTGDTLRNADAAFKVHEKHFAITPQRKWNVDNLYCLVWIVDAASKEILHSAETKLKP